MLHLTKTTVSVKRRADKMKSDCAAVVAILFPGALCHTWFCQILKPACEFYKRMAHIEGRKIISKCYFYGWWSSFVKMHFINLKKAFTEKKLLNSSDVKSLIVNIP